MANSTYEEETDFLRIYPKKFITIFFQTWIFSSCLLYNLPIWHIPTCFLGSKKCHFYHFYFSQLLVKKIVYTN